jgi:hypothetical protein
MRNSTSLSLISSVFILVVSMFNAVARAQTAPDFSVIVIPDPQNYSEKNPAIFKSQTQWIVNNAGTLNVRMVIGEGDMVTHDAVTTEWANADAAINTLDGKVPYTLAIGNHDYDNQEPSVRGATRFNAHFGPLRYASYGWYGGNLNSSNENFYTFFSNGAEQYMVLVLEFYPRESVISWAHSVLSSNADKKVIVVTHSFEGTDGMRVDLCDTQDMSASNGTSPQLLWSKLLAQHPNVFLVLSGHLIGNGSARRSDLDDQGNLVHQIFTNFQDWTGTKAGYLRILKFHPSLNTLDVITYSPWTNTYLTTPTYQFTLPIRATTATQVTGGFQGKVRSNGCIAIPAAQVSTAGFIATTNAKGVYSLPGLPAPNGYGVSVAAPYYTGRTTLGYVNAGFNTQQNFFVDSTVTAACTLNTADPSVTICGPAPNSTVASPVRVNAGTRSSRTLAYMQIYVDGENRGTFYTSAVDETYALTAGSHRVTVQAKDIGGVLTKTTTYFSVSTTANPTVTAVKISSPLNNAIVASPITVVATATPATGRTITSSTIYLDGINVYFVKAAAINTRVNASVGTHRLTVQVKDSVGGYAKSTIYVTVK